MQDECYKMLKTDDSGEPSLDWLFILSHITRGDHCVPMGCHRLSCQCCLCLTLSDFVYNLGNEI